MANNKSALKRIRQTKTRTDRNKVIKTQVKTQKKKILEAVGSGDAKAAQEQLAKFASVVDKAVKKQVFHANKAANLKSGAAAAVKAVSAS
ncbi:MAG: 30S ribosomal protein S20 [Verrucomicrobia bacterium]|nr:30S ribosomal protein S20 [Verrucomicrobiota bacterium]MDA1006940.1 30S ribosomal protein S20 [Verrucomicrobiota bacterium]